MPEMSEAELEAMEQRCEQTKAARQQLEEDNEKLDIELRSAREQLAKITEGKDGFESKLAKMEADIESTRIGMKDAEKSFNREKEDFRKDMEDVKEMMKNQARMLQKEFDAEEKKTKEGLDDLGVMEFNAASLGQDIENMHRRIEIQKEQMRMTQKFLEKLEKEKKDIEVMYDKLRKDHDNARADNAKAEVENMELQLQLLPEARTQYLHEAQQRDEGRPKPKKKKNKKKPPPSELDDEEYEESSRGGSSRYDDEPPVRRRGGGSSRQTDRTEKEMSILSARAARNRERDY